eukprot:CAMPEP_0175461396 /NCGR_PEP_ID=MMETSP0095-20121207/68139_1 /TAXON_ID=311494 /ORGANISM="Alexandrium monilatum, Strain CCMP3105" /LENGTH=33 /DNA_ID= /DNA_START= /DNA_END= /DNA_ORIENTATION=
MAEEFKIKGKRTQCQLCRDVPQEQFFPEPRRGQ